MLKVAALAAVLALLLVGCDAPPAAPAGADDPPLVLPEYPATHHSIANANLDFVINGARRAQPDVNPAAGRALVDALLTRVKFRNSFQDLDEALAVSERLLATRPQDASAHLLRTQALVTVHRFAEALDHLQLAAALGADPGEVARRQSTIAVATGNAAGQLSALQARAAATPHYGTLTAWAAALAEAGKQQDADDQYVKALEAYEDVSPFAVAWVLKQRGDLWRSARPHWSEQLYHAALAYLPAYVGARVNLAELEAGAGRHEAAIARLESTLQITDDPDVSAVLAAQLLRAGRRSRATPHIETARTGFEALLARHRLAFADHAAEFFAGPGNSPERARELLDALRASRTGAGTVGS